MMLMFVCLFSYSCLCEEVSICYSGQKGRHNSHCRTKCVFNLREIDNDNYIYEKNCTLMNTNVVTSVTEGLTEHDMSTNNDGRT